MNYFGIYNYTGNISTYYSVIWNATCNSLSYDMMSSFSVGTTASGTAIPEFSDYAFLLILVIVIGGFFVIRKKGLQKSI